MKSSPIPPHNPPPLQQLLADANEVNYLGRIDRKTSVLNKSSFALWYLISGCGRSFAFREGAALRVSVLDQHALDSPMNTVDYLPHSIVTIGEAR
jgi:hypothetical protein